MNAFKQDSVLSGSLLLELGQAQGFGIMFHLALFAGNAVGLVVAIFVDRSGNAFGFVLLLCVALDPCNGNGLGRFLPNEPHENAPEITIPLESPFSLLSITSAFKKGIGLLDEGIAVGGDVDRPRPEKAHNAGSNLSASAGAPPQHGVPHSDAAVLHSVVDNIQFRLGKGFGVILPVWMPNSYGSEGPPTVFWTEDGAVGVDIGLFGSWLVLSLDVKDVDWRLIWWALCQEVLPGVAYSVLVFQGWVKIVHIIVGVPRGAGHWLRHRRICGRVRRHLAQGFWPCRNRCPGRCRYTSTC